MTSKSFCLVPTILMVIAALLQNTSAAADGLPEAATVLDDKMIVYMRSVPLVSPNGRYVAFVSRGYVCVADIEAGASRRLAEVRGTWTHVFASTDEATKGGDADSFDRVLSRSKYNELQNSVVNEVSDFQWTASSDAVVYALSSYDTTQQAKQIGIWRAPLEGEPIEIASDNRSMSERRGPGGTITRDGRYLVGNFGRRRALIWDLATNKPRATPFLYLAPSPTSGRWIGVEKDTRQLVSVDDKFNIVDRYEEILPESRYGFDMIWSPDERFVIWREKIGFDYYSNWVGCRYDLETRERQIFTGDYMDEKVIFTGHRGEFLRVGANGVQRNFSGLDISDQYVAVVPDGRIDMQRFWSLRADPPGMSSKVRMLNGIARVTWSPDFQLFTIGLPRQVGPYGEVFHIADRKRHLWKLPGPDTGQYISPYHVAGFALDGKSIIAYDETRLFALPITAIQTTDNKVR